MRTLALCVVLLGCGADPSTALEPTAPEPTTEPAAPATSTPTANPTVTAAGSVAPVPTAAPSATAAPTTTPPATSTASASAAPPGPAPLEGANVNIGAFAADGLSLKDISCKSDAGGLGGLFGSMTIAAGLSKRKAALDKCGKGETRAHIWQKGGKVTKAEIVGESKVGPCVQKALVGAPATMDSECLLTIVHGQ
jgi:hypothetical protein